ncbi:MAG: glycoside hydrolase family 3 C-terminal domain-containing protein [Steroidobacter sp.]|nr:glycoside hydrolase family 3 C-terminal domain-containing protein [Steroidobacter sp.]
MSAAGLPTLASASEPPKAREIEQRVEVLLKQMTPEEKIDLLGGVNLFDVRGVPRIGVPPMATADGFFGVRRWSRSNVMPGGIALAATWNTALANQFGTQIGRDARARGVHFYLAPGVNIYRSPLNGRNFEYLGEDPFLAARIAVPFIEGVQSQGVAATVKHYFGNNSEFARHSTDSVIDERTAREIYLPVFEAAVKEANVAAVMGSYGLVNGEHMSQSRYYNVEVLKAEWGFDGVLMSDWDATYDTLGAANGGLDLEMPSGKFLNRSALTPLVKEGKVKQATLDDKVRRILRTAARLGWLDRPQLDPTIPRYNAAGREVALQTAREGIVLLKNQNNVLPLDKTKIRTIAVIGPNGYPNVLHGGGSVTVVPFHSTSLFEGLSQDLGTKVDVHYLRGILDYTRAANATKLQTAATGGKRGVNVEVFDNIELTGSPTATRVDRAINQGAPLDFTTFATGETDPDFAAMASSKRLSTRWTAYFTPEQAGEHDLFVQLGGFARVYGSRLYIDDKLIADHWNSKHVAIDQHRLNFEARPYKIVLEHRTQTGGLDGPTPFVRLGIVQAGKWVDPVVTAVAAKVDAVVIAAGFDGSSETEDWDRGFALPPGQNELIQAVATANPKTVVAITAGGAVDMPWLERVPGLVQAWYLGQEGGTALADVLLGNVNPSGHLPATFERRVQDNPTFNSYYPAAGQRDVSYAEGLFVGYRGYEKQGTQPQFAFGHGLSYTTFKFGDLAVKPATEAGKLCNVSFVVTNTGQRAGAVVSQLYVGDPQASVPRPAKELKGFAKVSLQPGESRTVTIALDARAFAFYDLAKEQWRAEAGAFQILVGDSSDNIALRGEWTLARDVTAARLGK